MNVEERRRMIACFMSSRMIFPMSFARDAVELDQPVRGHAGQPLAAECQDGFRLERPLLTTAAQICCVPGTAKTAVSMIAGAIRITSSMTSGASLSPPRLITSVVRPVITSRPSGVKLPRSPG
jgi:hypothetical protein